MNEEDPTKTPTYSKGMTEAPLHLDHMWAAKIDRNGCPGISRHIGKVVCYGSSGWSQEDTERFRDAVLGFLNGGRTSDVIKKELDEVRAEHEHKTVEWEAAKKAVGELQLEIGTLSNLLRELRNRGL